MLKEVSGDILNSKAAAIAHGVAPNDHFNQGLALSLREYVPAMYKDFRHYCQVAHPKPGSIWTWAAPDGRRFVNLMTQAPPASEGANPGTASVRNVKAALKELRKLIQDEKLTSIALPRLATGVGGLDWDAVKPLIEAQLDDLDIPVYLYTTYRKGVTAIE